MTDPTASTPQMPSPSEPSQAQLTPMMRQYLEIKAQQPDAILMFRLGDFYEMFFDDALKASETLQITLTARSKGPDKVPMCGVPYHAVKGYIAKLVEAGFKVALCDQTELPGRGSIVRREITRIVSPGMVVDGDLLDAQANNFLCAVSLDASGGGLALLDASTGDFQVTELDADPELIEEIARSGAREVIVAETARQGERIGKLARALPQAAFNAFDDGAFDFGRAEDLLCRHFGTQGLDGFGLRGRAHAVAAAGAALAYLKQTQRSEAGHVDRLSVLESSAAMVLDESTRSNLELVRTQRDGKRKGSLLGVLDRCTTAMGSRRLARWISYPLLDVGRIQQRLDAVEELFERAVQRDELSQTLKRIADLERLTARLSLGQGNARDLRALANSLLELPGLAERLSICNAPLLRAQLPLVQGLDALAAHLDAAVALEPPLALKEGGLIREGYNAELDQIVALSTRGKDYLLKLEADERARTGIQSLKVRYNRVFGYFIEVTRANLHLVPRDYVRKQTTVGAERFITEELKNFEEQVLHAEERRVALEARLFEALRAEVVAQASALRQAADAVALVDAIQSLARVAASNGYARPEIDESDVLDIVEGRHPVIEQMTGSERFVPNDLALDGARAQLMVITGPNMAGKSTVMRQTALIVLMAQVGSFVPARRARVGLVDRIFTRVGAADNLVRGQSTFMVEMIETAAILHNATRRSLILLDEIGRGTSTFDGLSIAWAVAEQIHDRIGARTLFATHYHELTDLARECPRVRNATIAVKELDGSVVFLRKLVQGAASRSYGIEVARLAGLPPEVLDRACQILANLERQELDDAGRPNLMRAKKARPGGSQLALFGQRAQADLKAPPRSKILETLRLINPERMTPLDALVQLVNLKKALGEEDAAGQP